MARKAPVAAAPHTEEFVITRRPGWAFLGEIRVQIECDPLASTWAKLGLAVRAAFQSGASLDGARLDGASLDGASLDGASLDGASLDGASLVGATIYGEEIVRCVAIVPRLIDPFVFYGFEMKAGGIKIKAGCRWFTLAEFRSHVARVYPDTPKAVETLAILDFIEGRARALEAVLERPKAEAA